MKIYNSDAQGNPAYTPRYWYDPWLLIAEMTMCLSVGLFLLVDGFAYRYDSEDLIYDLKQHFLMAWDVFQCYRRSMKGGK